WSSTLSLHGALPIFDDDVRVRRAAEDRLDGGEQDSPARREQHAAQVAIVSGRDAGTVGPGKVERPRLDETQPDPVLASSTAPQRSEEHTSEVQSREK